MRPGLLCVAALLAAPVSVFADGPAFDAASITPAGPDVQPPFIPTGGPGTNDPGRFRAARVSLETLLMRAFGVASDQIIGPAWLRDARNPTAFTVVATMPPDTTKEQFEQMLQNLLIERFHLVFHRETRPFPGYELVVDKGGPKLKEVTPTENAAAPGDARGALRAARGPDGFPNFPGPRTITMSGRDGVDRTKYQERSMAEFVSNLGFVIGSSQGRSVLDGNLQPRVADKTGLTGKYTFVLEFYSRGSADLARQFNPPAAPTGAPPAASEPEGGAPDIFTAIQKQLGLRLEKTAGVPLDVIIVESVDKSPTAN